MIDRKDWRAQEVWLAAGLAKLRAGASSDTAASAADSFLWEFDMRFPQEPEDANPAPRTWEDMEKMDNQAAPENKAERAPTNKAAPKPADKRDPAPVDTGTDAR